MKTRSFLFKLIASTGNKGYIVNTATIYNIDIELLKNQRNYLLTLPTNNNIDGIINLLDAILDNLEGFD